MNVSYEQVRAFVAVAEKGSFSAAARKLGKHRTTLGQVVANLEVELNMVLFDRDGKFPVLTQHGHSLLKHAKSLSESSIAFESLCQTIESGEESDITIFHTDLLPIGLIRSTMSELRKEFPRVNVHWLHRSNDEARKAIVSGEADLSIMIANQTTSISPQDYVYLMSMPFTVVAAPGFFSSNNSMTVSELRSYRELLLEDYVYSEIDSVMVVSTMLQRIENMNILVELLMLGDGWAVVPNHAIEQELAKGSLVEIKVKELNTPLRFPLTIWSMNQSNSGPVRKRVIELLSSHAKQFECIA